MISKKKAFSKKPFGIKLRRNRILYRNRYYRYWFSVLPIFGFGIADYFWEFEILNYNQTDNKLLEVHGTVENYGTFSVLPFFLEITYIFLNILSIRYIAANLVTQSLRNPNTKKCTSFIKSIPFLLRNSLKRWDDLFIFCKKWFLLFLKKKLK